MITNSYKIFISVAKFNNFYSAAKDLHLTPSAISHSINKLEAELGISLFIRDKRGAKLTYDGEQLLFYAQKIIDNEEALLQNAARLSGKDTGTVVIGTVNSVCQHWLPNIINTFTKLYPKINIIVHQGGYQDIVTWLETGQADIGFLPEPLAKQFDFVRVHKERLICVVPNNFKPKNNISIEVSDINNLTLVNQSNVNNIDTSIFLSKHNLKFDSPFSINDDQSLIAIVESGLGFCIMPELVAKGTRANVRIFPFNPSEFRTICLVKSKRSQPLPATLKMFNHIQHYINENNLNNI